jgi:hypothetical protein
VRIAVGLIALVGCDDPISPRDASDAPRSIDASPSHDEDGDGIPDARDNCPADPNPAQASDPTTDAAPATCLVRRADASAPNVAANPADPRIAQASVGLYTYGTIARFESVTVFDRKP